MGLVKTQGLVLTWAVVLVFCCLWVPPGPFDDVQCSFLEVSKESPALHLLHHLTCHLPRLTQLSMSSANLSSNMTGPSNSSRAVTLPEQRCLQIDGSYTRKSGDGTFSPVSEPSGQESGMESDVPLRRLRVLAISLKCTVIAVLLVMTLWILSLLRVTGVLCRNVSPSACVYLPYVRVALLILSAVGLCYILLCHIAATVVVHGGRRESRILTATYGSMFQMFLILFGLLLGPAAHHSWARLSRWKLAKRVTSRLTKAWKAW